MHERRRKKMNLQKIFTDSCGIQKEAYSHSQGETREEALKNIQEATKLYLEVANEKAIWSSNR
jgi:TnpA family transposase